MGKKEVFIFRWERKVKTKLLVIDAPTDMCTNTQDPLRGLTHTCTETQNHPSHKYSMEMHRGSHHMQIHRQTHRQTPFP